MPTATTARKPRVTTPPSKPPRVQQAVLDASCCDTTWGGHPFPRNEGFKAGESWAKTMTLKQARNVLRTLEELAGMDGVTTDEEFCWHFEFSSDYDVAQELYLDLRGEFGRYDRLASGEPWPDRRAEAMEWWEKVLGDHEDADPSSGEFLKGFFIGALCVARARRAARAKPGPRKIRSDSGQAAGHGVPAAR